MWQVIDDGTRIQDRDFRQDVIRMLPAAFIISVSYPFDEIFHPRSSCGIFCEPTTCFGRSAVQNSFHVILGRAIVVSSTYCVPLRVAVASFMSLPGGFAHCCEAPLLSVSVPKFVSGSPEVSSLDAKSASR